MKKTYLNEFHANNGGQMVDFAGWEMPVNYGSQISEHKEVRENVGIFDVSHMAVFDFAGSRQVEFLKHLLPNDVNKILDSTRALYSPLLNDEGMILDDLIVYHLGNENFRIISNCGTRDQNNAWFKKMALNFDVAVDFKEEASIIALQGPKAKQCLGEIFDVDLEPFHIQTLDDVMIARTGYTGEVGFEIISNASRGLELWNHFIEKGIKPVGLAARDTLRLEAGFNLYGSDMTIENHPYESNLGWTIDMSNDARDFIGKSALLDLQSDSKKLVGFHTDARGVLRSGTEVYFDGGSGIVTSGTWSPTFGKNIGLCRVDSNHPDTGNAKLRDKEINLHFCETNFLKYLK